MTTPSRVPAELAAGPGPAPLLTLLDDAADAGPAAAVWPVLARRARVVTAQLADAGWLPGHLVVEVTDAPVVIARTLAVAHRVLGRAPAPTARLERARCA